MTTNGSHGHRQSALRERHVAAWVADDGRGVSPEQLLYLFRRYGCIEGDISHRGSAGFAFGLAICKGPTEEESGPRAMDRDSVCASPSLFRWPNRPSRMSPLAGNGRARTYIGVGSRPADPPAGAGGLSKAGYTPVLTPGPDEALRLVEADRPELVFLGLVFPDTNGIELMQDIPDIVELPAIFLTAHGREQNIGRAFDLAAYDYMVKPFSPTDFTAHIRAAMR